ncbi:MAG: VPLPA-CTERM sorting domain-containing protein [Pseudomonadota bacterium]
MKSIVFAGVLAGTFLGAAVAAQAAVIDFDAADASAGQTVGFTTYSEDGFTFGVTTTGANDGAAIFDTTCTGYTSNCNGDRDLVPTSQGLNGVSGNVLILQDRRSGKATPNDAARPGSITFELLSGPAFQLTSFSAVDDGTFTISDAGGVLATIALASDNQTGQASFLSSIINVGDSFTISYSGSGAVDALALMPAPIPLPAAMPMLALALGGLVAMRRRALV